MSDWEDEPTPAKGRGFGDKPPAKDPKEVGGWSDDEGGKDKSGGGGGYRKGGDSGYRGRRDDDNAMELPPIPSSCNKDVVAAFIDHLDLEKHKTTLADVRALRDYLFTAFKDLVSSEWLRLESLDREERARKAQQIREAADMMDSLIMDVNGLLGETEMGTPEDNVIGQLKLMGIDWEQNGPHLDTQAIVVPQTTSETSRAWRAPRAKKTGEKKGEEIDTEPAFHRVKQIIDIYNNAHRLNEEQQNGLAASIAEEDYEEVAGPEPSPTYGSSRYRQRLSESFLNLHKMRTVKFGNIGTVLNSLPWPILPLSAWSDNLRSHRIIRCMVEVHRERELITEPTIKPPETGIRAPDNSSSSIQTSRQIDLVRQHQIQETPDRAYFSRYDATRDEEAAWSATGGTIGEVATEHALSTPQKRDSELGLSLPDNLNLSMMLGGGSTSTPAATPSMPAEFPLESVVDSGTLMLSVDNEETAIVGAAASSSSVLRSSRLAGGTPASTPLHNFRPLLPVINEEHHQFIPAIPRVLEMTISSPPFGVEEASVVPVAGLTEPTAVSPSRTQRRDWTSIFRPRDQIIGYAEMSATPRRAVKRTRLRRPASDPATVANNPETPQEQIQGEVEVVSARSSQETTTIFMANLLQKAAEFNATQHLTKPTASATLPATENDNHPVLDEMRPQAADANVKIIQVEDHGQPSYLKGRTNDESCLQKPRCPMADTTATAAEEVLDPARAPEKVLHPLAAALQPTDPNEKITDMEATIDILNISEINLEQPCLPTVEPMEVGNLVAQEDPSITSLANLSVHAIVTDVQILRGPTNMAPSSCNLTASTSNLCKEVVKPPVTGSKAECSITAVAAERASLNECRPDNSLYHRGSIVNLSYLVQHADMLRLMIDRHKELSVDKNTQLSSDAESLESSSKGYLFMPAVKIYDPKIILNMSEAKVRLVHRLLGALIMEQQVDMQSASFIKNRMDAAVTFRLLLDLKAANIIKLSKDGRFFSLE